MTLTNKDKTEKEEKPVVEQTQQGIVEKKKGFLGKNWFLLLMIAVMIAAIIWGAITVAGGGFSFGKSASGTKADGDVYELTKRDVNEAIRINGTIASANSKSVGSDVTGVKILKMNVEVGDVVKEGDVICVLDSSRMETQLENLNKNMNVTDANSGMTVDESIRDRDKTVYDANVNVAQAEEGITDAQEKYNQAYNACCYAKSDYDKAKEKYDAAVSSRDGANEAVTKAEEALEKARKKNQVSANTVPDERIKALEQAVATARTLRDSANTAVDAADTAKESCRRSYETACNNLASYERSVNDAVQKKDSTIFDFAHNYTNNTDTIEKSRLADSIDNLNAELDAADLEDQIAHCTITAPISGRITAVAGEEGRKYTGGQIVAIQDDADLNVEAIVDQYDIADVAEGQEAVIRTDATGDEEMDGTVTFVSATPKTETNATTLEVTTTTNYPIKITLKKANDRLRLGMTAKINILMKSAKDVFAVPFDCIQKDDDGAYISIVDEDATAKQSKKDLKAGKKVTNRVAVTVGLETDYYTEISGEGLTEGMKVLIPTQSTDPLAAAGTVTVE